MGVALKEQVDITRAAGHSGNGAEGRIGRLSSFGRNH